MKTAGMLQNFLVQTLERQRPLGNSKRRGERDIKFKLRQISFGNMNWIGPAQYRDLWLGAWTLGRMELQTEILFNS
jgi:hypothetical protein